MKIGVFGMGYVGLSNALMFSCNNEVIGFDLDKHKVSLLNSKVSPIKDSEIEQYLTINSNISFISSEETNLSGFDLFIIATPTNFNAETKNFDTSSIAGVVKKIRKYDKNVWILIKSTVDIGFTIKINNIYHNIIFSPEFLREGKALYDCLNPSRIVIGIPSKNRNYTIAAHRIESLYKESILKKDAKCLIIGSSEAESIKLFSNTYLAMRVSFFNELDTYCVCKKLNSEEIISGICLDNRIGNYYNNPSFGYGGYCLPKDTNELKSHYEGIPEKLISSIVDSNKVRKQFISKDILNFCKKITKRKSNFKIGIYRLTMKSDSDNFRSSSTIDIMEMLASQGAEILIYEPSLEKESFNLYEVCNSFDDFLGRSDIVVANRIDKRLNLFKGKVYSRDIFGRD